MRLNAVSYYADFFLSAAAILILTGDMATQVGALQVVQLVASVAVGFTAWTALEYFVHRVLYHNVPFFKELHDAHHAEPNAFVGAPPVIALVLIFALTYVPVVAVSELAASGLTIGLLLGYMAYMLLHHAAHYWKLPTSSWLYRARRHHALHHHHHVEGNYGITTGFWDRVFGTALEPSRLPRLKLR